MRLSRNKLTCYFIFSFHDGVSCSFLNKGQTAAFSIYRFEIPEKKRVILISDSSWIEQAVKEVVNSALFMKECI